LEACYAISGRIFTGAAIWVALDTLQLTFVGSFVALTSIICCQCPDGSITLNTVVVGVASKAVIRADITLIVSVLKISNNTIAGMLNRIVFSVRLGLRVAFCAFI